MNCNVFYLTVRAVDKNNEAISDVTVSISASDFKLKESLYTNKKGNARFRLPIGDYDISGRLQTSHYLKEIDQNVSSSIQLRQGSETVKLKYSEFPPSFVSTPAFYGITLPILILVIIIFLIWYFVIRKHQKAQKTEIEEEPEDKTKPLPPAGPLPMGKVKVKMPVDEKPDIPDMQGQMDAPLQNGGPSDISGPENGDPIKPPEDDGEI